MTHALSSNMASFASVEYSWSPSVAAEPSTSVLTAHAHASRGVTLRLCVDLSVPTV